MNPRNFFAKLKRRNVYKVAVAYAVVARFFIQVATQVGKKACFLLGKRS